jgi:serine/threonine protein kinase
MSSDGKVTLEERLRSGPMPVDEAVRVVWGLCDRFEKAGTAQTLGDVAPARVTLFGRSVEVHIPDASLVPGYSAPERARSGPTLRSDVFAMGALLAHAVSGRPPDGTPLPPEAGHLQAIVNRCLAVDPKARFENLSELKKALVRLDKTLMSGPRSAGSLPVVRTSLGPWNIEGLLGQGSMGHVFKARHQSLGRLAAIKVLRSEQYQQPELIQRFFQEARTVNQINHEHIVEISDFVQEPGESGPAAVYCVMEFLQGRTLGDVAEDQPLPLDRGLRIVEQVCDALAAAHRVGVVHRDVKPDNIMLIERGGSKDYVKVLDFGVAKLTDTDGKAMVATTEGAIIGTPICMSPEQAQGDAIDARSDIWAVGIILYKLLTGAFPFDAPTFVNIAVQIITKPFAPLPSKNQVGEAIPARLKALVEKCLQKHREARPQTMVEVRDELRAILRGESASGASFGGGRRVALAVGALIAVAALGAGAWFLRPPPPPPLQEPRPPPLTVLEPLPAVEGDAGGAPEQPVDAGGVAVAAVEDAGVEAPEDAGVVVEAPSSKADAGTPRLKPVKPVELTEAIVEQFQSQRVGAVKKCTTRFLKELPQTGAAVVDLEFRGSGDVRVKRLEAPGPAEFKACVKAALEQGRVTPLLRATTVTMTFPWGRR